MRLERPALRLLIGRPGLVGAEIGVHMGINALDILMELRIKKLYLIDHYEGMYNIHKDPTPNTHYKMIAQDRLRIFNHCIEWIFKRSQDVTNEIPDNSLDFAYIDGSHKHHEVLADCKLYWEKVKPGGLLCGHDFNNEVEAAVRDFALLDYLKLEYDLSTDPGDWWIWKL